MGRVAPLVVVGLMCTAAIVMAKDQPMVASGYDMSCEGIIRAVGSPLRATSPSGGYSLSIEPLRGDFHEMDVALVLSSPGTPDVRLPRQTGNAFFVTDDGHVVTIATTHAMGEPSRVRVLDGTGRTLHTRSVSRLSDATMATDGARLIYRSQHGIVAMSLTDYSDVRYPQLDVFAAGPANHLVGVRDGSELIVYRDTNRLLSLPLEERPRCLAFSENGVQVYMLTKSTIERVEVASAERRTLFTADAHTELRDMKLSDGNLIVGFRRVAEDTVSGGLLILAPDGRLTGIQAGPTRSIPVSVDRSRGRHEPIPWPLQPNSQHPVGNTYGEYQNYGSSYLHPGVDIMGDPGQPLYAVADGVVKAIITTSGEWHWRIATGEPGSGTSTGYLYAHVDEPTIAVNVGDPVVAGQYLGDLVDWPVYGFTHVHFARIEDSGSQWYGNWLCTDNPHLDLPNQSESEAPLFEPAVGNDLLAFCENQTSSYMLPTAIEGEVDIIAHIGDTIETDWVCTVQEIRYTIYPAGSPSSPIVDNKLAIFFDMALDTYQGGPIDPFLVDLLYKQDSTCRTSGDYDTREFFHILTNSDGDQNYEQSDQWEAWDTSALPDADYVVRVTATDVAGNVVADSMVVTTDNGNPTSVEIAEQDASIALWSRPNPAPSRTEIVFSLPATGHATLSVYDLSGKLVRRLLASEFPRGFHSVKWDGRDENGARVPSGVFFTTLVTRAGTKAESLVLIR